jgi:hypothetical protein
MKTDPAVHPHEVLWKRIVRRTLPGPALLLAGIGIAHAHHTYAMFDGAKSLTVRGTIAKVEWSNPHVFVWMYVLSQSTPGKYDLYAFESGSIGELTRLGWSSNALKAGDEVTVDYHPLRDRRPGGHLTTATTPDGRILRCLSGPTAQPPPPAVPPQSTSTPSALRPLD